MGSERQKNTRYVLDTLKTTEGLLTSIESAIANDADVAQLVEQVFRKH